MFVGGGLEPPFCGGGLWGGEFGPFLVVVYACMWGFESSFWWWWCVGECRGSNPLFSVDGGMYVGTRTILLMVVVVVVFVCVGVSNSLFCGSGVCVCVEGFEPSTVGAF